MEVDSEARARAVRKVRGALGPFALSVANLDLWAEAVVESVLAECVPAEPERRESPPAVIVGASELTVFLMDPATQAVYRVPAVRV